jgi:hypothetical protein
LPDRLGDVGLGHAGDDVSRLHLGVDVDQHLREDAASPRLHTVDASLLEQDSRAVNSIRRLSEDTPDHAAQDDHERRDEREPPLGGGHLHEAVELFRTRELGERGFAKHTGGFQLCIRTEREAGADGI